MPNSNFYSNGKLLLTGEYLVLDGALALALPTKFGQTLQVEPINERKLVWQSFDENGKVWFEDEYLFEEICFPFIFDTHIKKHTSDISKTLLKALFHLAQINRLFFNDYVDSYIEETGKINNNGFKITTHLNFPKAWGLGTSSTLINNLANWAQVNPYELLKKTFGGSGYDIACAQHNKPIIYQLKNNNKILNQVQHNETKHVTEVDFNPVFKDALYFVYLNKKQNSREAIKSYRKNRQDLSKSIKLINSSTKSIINTKSLSEFNTLITEHEQIIGHILKQQPIKERLFSDYKGAIKSLGAWGGDFILVTATENPSAYFKAKGFETVISYSDIILSK